MSGLASAAQRPVSTAAAVAGLGGLVALGAVVAAFAPLLDHALNPGSTRPGLLSFLGVGLTVLALTAVLLLYGLRGMLPRTGVFAGAALGCNSLLIAVKLGLGPIAVYAQNDYYRAHPLPPGQHRRGPWLSVPDIEPRLSRAGGNHGDPLRLGLGLAFIAAYHILWAVFLLTLVATWPLKPWAYLGGGK